MASNASNPAVIHMVYQARTAASSQPRVLRRYSKIRRLFIGWTSHPIVAAMARTLARSWKFEGRRGGVGYRSSSHSTMAGDCVRSKSRSTRACTSPCGFSALKEAPRCSSVRRSTATYSKSRPFKFNAMRSRWEVPLQKNYLVSWKSLIRVKVCGCRKYVNKIQIPLCI